MVRCSSDGGGQSGSGEKKLDSEGKDYLDKLTNALKKNQKIPYKPRVQGMNREVVVPSGSKDSVQRLSTAAPERESQFEDSSDLRESGTFQKPALQQDGTPIPRRSSASVPRPTFTHQAPIGTFPMGTILLFEDSTIGIYKDVRPGKEYEVVMILNPDGTVDAQGIALETYELKAIGFLTPEFVLRIQRRKLWERDEIIFHLNSFDYCKSIPQPRVSAAPAQEKRSTGEVPRPSQVEVKKPVVEKKASELVPGRHFTINFGPTQEWKAIYWGEDDLGTVIAHKTNENWSLMHMDLTRFKDSIVLGEMAGRDLLDTIHSQVGNG